jgi:hypothetical protein
VYFKRTHYPYRSDFHKKTKLAGRFNNFYTYHIYSFYFSVEGSGMPFRMPQTRLSRPFRFDPILHIRKNAYLSSVRLLN